MGSLLNVNYVKSQAFLHLFFNEVDSIVISLFKLIVKLNSLSVLGLFSRNSMASHPSFSV